MCGIVSDRHGFRYHKGMVVSEALVLLDKRQIGICVLYRRDPYPNPPAGRLQTPIHARLALHQAEVDHASAQAGRVWMAALQ